MVFILFKFSEQEEPTNFDSLLLSLSKDWLMLENRHTISKTASNELWSLGRNYFVRMGELRQESFNKIPQLRSLRDKLHEEYVPNIKLEVAYQSKSTGDIIVMRDIESTPVKQFPPSEFIKIYESASVEVSIYACNIQNKETYLLTLTRFTSNLFTQLTFTNH